LTALSLKTDQSLNEAAVDSLLRQAGRDSDRMTVSLCAPGGNNRIFEIGLPGERLVVKHYARRSTVGRDRMLSEWAFLKFAEAAGLSCTPRALAIDLDADLALYEFVDGTKCHAKDISDGAIDKVAAFVRGLNSPQARQLGASLPEASETSFSISGHLAITETRLARLTSACDEDNDGALARSVSRLDATFERLRNILIRDCERSGLDVESKLALTERVISPSDLGFHNLLVRPDGEFVFVDFEYAGWDDPAKLVADFFLQPAVPVSAVHRDAFVRYALPELSDAGHRRLSLLHPLFALRWCLIFLNPFLPDWIERHPSALNGVSLAELRRARLERAGQLTEEVENLLREAESGPAPNYARL